MCCVSSLYAEERTPWISGTSLLKKHYKEAYPEYQRLDQPKHISTVKDSTPPKWEIGDERIFWAYNLTTFTQYTLNSVCAYVGEQCYVFVEDSQWHTNGGAIVQSYIDSISLLVEESTPGDSTRGIYDLECEKIGDIPDLLDNDPRVYFLLLDIKDGWEQHQGAYAAGYFDPWNQQENLEFGIGNYGVFSNECEMLYIDTHPGLDRAGIEVIGEVLAHEFQHLIHDGLDRDEETWLDEGCANYAAFLAGYIIDVHISSFLDHPEFSLVSFDNYLAEYGGTFLFILYLYEHFGGVDFMRSLIQSPKHSIDSINSTLAEYGYRERFEEIFINWTIANYIDDESIGIDSIYAYKNLELAKFDTNDIRYGLDPTGEYDLYPIEIRNTQTPYLSSAYYLFRPRLGDDITIRFDGEDISDYHITLIHNGVDIEIETLNLDDANNVIEVIHNFPRYYYDATLIVTNLANDDNTFSYAVIEDTEITKTFVYPNPAVNDANINFEFSLNVDTSVKLSIFTLDGTPVRTFWEDMQEAENNHIIIWDGTNEEGVKVSGGIYLYTLQYKLEELTMWGYEIKDKLLTGKIAIVR